MRSRLRLCHGLENNDTPMLPIAQVPEPPPTAHPVLLLIIELAILLSLSISVGIVARLSQHKTVLPYQPRRPVPWRGLHLVLVLLIYLVTQWGMAQWACGLFGAKPPAPAEVAAEVPKTTEHVVAQLLAEKNAWLLVLSGIVAVIVAPMVEEFLFRVLLQGWLEAVERRLRRRVLGLFRLLPIGLGPIMLSSLLFAGMHFREETPEMPVRLIVCLLVSNALANLLTMFSAVVLLQAIAGATAADFGWAPEKLPGDVRQGLLAFTAAIVPIYGLQLVLQNVVPKQFSPDPIALFFFAMLLGTLYFRTHRIVPSLVAHASLNATSLLLAWWTLK
jgi:membrane protease YdiL (CAAX protease family)